jgi:predicted DNA-binding WGR domain protein
MTNMNRTGAIDSEKSLDVTAFIWNNQRTYSSHSDWPPMHDDNLSDAIADHSQLPKLADTQLSKAVRLERIEPERNMARYYTLAVELTLFADWSCTRQFGRIGARGGRIMLGLFEDRAAAEVELVALLRAKQARGYTITTP